MPRITFDESAADTVAEAFGHQFNDEGLLVEIATGLPVLSVGGKRVSREAFAGYGDVDGDAVPVRDDFNEICDLVERQHGVGRADA